MKINGKSKEDFENWLYETHRSYLKDILEMDFEIGIILNSLIIEWLDSVEIYILIDYIIDTFDVEIKDYRVHEKECVRYYVDDVNSRQQAIEKAIEKANEIYNEINK